MTFKVYFTPEAQEELDNAIMYYLSVSDNSELAGYFVSKVESALKVLSTSPYFQIRTKNFRAIPVNRFPYLIFFEILEKEKAVKILALFNTNQDAKKWP